MGELHFVLLLPTIINILKKGMARLLSELTPLMPEHGEAIADSTNNCGNRLLREGAMDKMHCALPTSAGS